MKRFKTVILMAGVLLSFSAVPVHAQGVWEACKDGKAPVTGSTAICGDKSEGKTVVKQIIDLFFYAIGILSAIMIVFSGVKYVTSNGDPEKIKSAKSTLQYSIIGLIVALLAFTIVNFVVSNFDKTAMQTGEHDSSLVA